MSRPNEQHSMIPEVVYWEKVRKNESYRGFVIYNDGTISYVLPEVVVTARQTTESMGKYTQYTMIPSVKYIERPIPGIKIMNDKIQFDNGALEVKMDTQIQQGIFNLSVNHMMIDAFERHFQQKEYNRVKKDLGILALGLTSPDQVNVEKSLLQREFKQLKQKVLNNTLKPEDIHIFDYPSIKKEIGYYFYIQHIKENPHLNPKHSGYIGMANAVVNAGLSYGTIATYNKSAWLNIRNMKYYKHNFNGNQHMTKPMLAEGKARALKASKAFGKLGTGLTLVSMGGTGVQYWNDEINTAQFVAEETSSFISWKLPFPYGAAWGLGWEGGRLITETEGYQNFKYYYILPWRREQFGY
ncbi:hypothetical protein [Dysgonomonas sp. 25]|uniref:hypothetical protein n=1 Tax=Dysgonomonas sp. 25 TaxID=2302933 RepID=UPI0013D72C2D|nr:hypothetical protein [Dysgonomonas sp. 25]NDV69691.1 hypothetical protein [Dysgonomonas sp. 25]